MLLTLVAALLSSSGPAQTRPADHVILISIDGLRPEFYRDPSWPAPVLQRMASEGAHAHRVRGVFPSVTYPTHTTMITGAYPARHGIYYNSPFEPGGQTGRWYWHADSIRVPTLWHAARAAGLKAASLTWPASVNAPVDRLVPEIWPLDDTPRRELLARLSRPPGFLEELEREATGRLVAYDKEGPTDEWGWVWTDSRTAAMAEYLLATFRPNLMTIHLVQTDDAQHAKGREAWEVRRAVAGVDHAIARLVSAAERAGLLDRTAFVITGDHGFLDISTRLAPNVWLVQAGLQEARDDRGEWRAAFHVQAASAFVHLREPGDQEALHQVRHTVESLPPAVRRLFRIVERDELERIGADPRVPLALTGAPGVSMTAANTGAAVRPGSGGTHGFFPDLHPHMYTGFVAWGAGVRQGVAVTEMGIEDVAAFVAALLDLEFRAPDGVLRPGLLR